MPPKPVPRSGVATTAGGVGREAGLARSRGTAEPGRNRAGHRDAAAIVVLAVRSFMSRCRAGERPRAGCVKAQVITKRISGGPFGRNKP